MDLLKRLFLLWLGLFVLSAIGGALYGLVVLFSNPLEGLLILVVCAVVGVCFFLLLDLDRWSIGTGMCLLGFVVVSLAWGMTGSHLGANADKGFVAIAIAISLLLLIGATVLRKKS